MTEDKDLPADSGDRAVMVRRHTECRGGGLRLIGEVLGEVLARVVARMEERDREARRKAEAER